MLRKKWVEERAVRVMRTWSRWMIYTQRKLQQIWEDLSWKRRRKVKRKIGKVLSSWWRGNPAFGRRSIILFQIHLLKETWLWKSNSKTSPPVSGENPLKRPFSVFTVTQMRITELLVEQSHCEKVTESLNDSTVQVWKLSESTED